MDTDNGTDEIRMLFPTVIQVSQIADHETLNNGLLKVIDEVKRNEPNSKPDAWSCDLFTTIGAASTFLTYQGVETFRAIVIEKVMKYADALKMDTANHPPRDERVLGERLPKEPLAGDPSASEQCVQRDLLCKSTARRSRDFAPLPDVGHDAGARHHREHASQQLDSGHYPGSRQDDNFPQQPAS